MAKKVMDNEDNGTETQQHEDSETPQVESAEDAGLEEDDMKVLTQITSLQDLLDISRGKAILKLKDI